MEGGLLRLHGHPPVPYQKYRAPGVVGPPVSETRYLGFDADGFLLDGRPVGYQWRQTPHIGHIHSQCANHQV